MAEFQPRGSIEKYFHSSTNASRFQYFVNSPINKCIQNFMEG